MIKYHEIHKEYIDCSCDGIAITYYFNIDKFKVSNKLISIDTLDDIKHWYQSNKHQIDNITKLLGD